MSRANIHSRRRPRAARRSDYLDAMSLAATGVNIVTTDGPAGRAGLTVSAMSSVAADGPAPQLLVCVNRSGSAGQAILENGVFLVNVLRDDQMQLSDIFAGRSATPARDRFSCASWAPMTTGAPRIIDPLAAFDCRIAHVQIVATHLVIFGSVVDIFSAKRGTPLLYTGRAYTSPGRPMPAVLAA